MDDKEVIATLKEELRKAKIELFITVRNTTVLPRGLLLGKSEIEVATMTLKTIEEARKIIDYNAVEKVIELAEKEIKKSEGKNETN